LVSAIKGSVKSQDSVQTKITREVWSLQIATKKSPSLPTSASKLTLTFGGTEGDQPPFLPLSKTLYS
jgi:hypothetical protein